MLNWLKRGKPKKADDPASPAALPEERLIGVTSCKRQGDEHVRAGRLSEAERFYRQTEEADPEYPGSLVMLGYVLKEQGRFPEAKSVLEHAVVVAAQDADGHFLLSGVLAVTGPADLEISHLQSALRLRPDFVQARRQLTAVLCRVGEWTHAEQLCDAGIKLLPGSADLYFDRSGLYEHANDKARAIACCEQALSLNRDLGSAQQALSRLLLDTGQLEAAERSYRRETELTPTHFGPFHMLGVVLNGLGKHAEAIAHFERAIVLKPNSGASYASLAAAYLDLDDSSENSIVRAQDSLETAARLDPDNAEIQHNLALNHWRRNEPKQALASFDRAIAADPSNVKARWARAMVWAAPYRAAEAGVPDRAGFADELGKFEHWWAQNGLDATVFVGELQPFYLTYQEEDNVALFSQYGHLCAAMMQRWLAQQPALYNIRPIEKRVRVGIVSADIRLHSIWMALVKGWFQSLDRELFEIVTFSLASHADNETEWAQAKSDVFARGPKDLLGWVKVIREQSCEVLLYPAIGLDPMTQKLASLRLSPIQITTWGHPETSGSPTIDYYVSAHSFESANAQRFYSEKLVLLPNLGNFVQPMNLSGGEADLATLGIDPARPILVCPGTAFKYQPEHDHVFIELARRLPNAQLVFFARPESVLARLLRSRLIQAFEAAGLKVADHVRFVRWLNFNEFHGLLRSADVLLDTIGFSGYNTAVQAVECGLPIVTREGRFLRGRLASGVLRRMGLIELIVESEVDYVDLVERLVSDRKYAMHVREEIRQRRPVLYDDRASMTAFQRFLEAVARPSATEGHPARP